MDFAKQKTGEERRQVGNGMRSDSKAKVVRFLPAFLIRPRYRSATFPPGEGIMGRTVGDAGPYKGERIATPPLAARNDTLLGAGARRADDIRPYDGNGQLIIKGGFFSFIRLGKKREDFSKIIWYSFFIKPNVCRKKGAKKYETKTIYFLQVILGKYEKITN